MTDHTMAPHIEACRKAIRETLIAHPGISKTALSACIRPGHGPMWRSVLEEMVQDGEVIEEEADKPYGRRPLIYTLAQVAA